MAQVTISINSREYAIACEDGQELRILQLSRLLDEKAKLLTNGTNQINESMLLAMVGLLLADELSELKKNPNNIQNNQDNINNIDNLKRIDDELANSIKILDEKIKTLAKEINML